MHSMFSVIIPAYNAQAYIGETVESALAQRDAKYEVIVVDDGSEDRTLDILREFGSHVKVYTQRNAGCSMARNLGASKAAGEFLAFLDADDLWLPDKLWRQLHKLQEGYDMAYTNRFNIGNRGDIPEIQSCLDTYVEGDIFPNLLLGNFITNSSVAIKRKVFMALGGFNVNLKTCEDWELWLRVSMNHRIGACQEPLVKYRMHAGCKSMNYRRQNAARLDILLSIFNTQRGQAISPSERKKILAKALGTSAWAAARSKDLLFSLELYRQALTYNPMEPRLWYDVLRVLARRA